MRVFGLTQINTIHMGASLLGHIHIHIEEAHRVSKVVLGARIQHQHGIVGRGVWVRLLVSVWPLGSVQHLADAETSSSSLGAQHPRGVRQDGQNFV